MIYKIIFLEKKGVWVGEGEISAGYTTEILKLVREKRASLMLERSRSQISTKNWNFKQKGERKVEKAYRNGGPNLG